MVVLTKSEGSDVNPIKLDKIRPLIVCSVEDNELQVGQVPFPNHQKGPEWRIVIMVGVIQVLLSAMIFAK